jgi:uncharacterized peroxidase-related enzyme
VTHHGAVLARESGDGALQEAVASGSFDELPPRMAALCRYALKLTLQVHDMSATDVLLLREAGFDDRAIVDANQVVAYFNYVNRVAEGLGIELEDYWPEDLRGHHSYELRSIVLNER